MWSDNETDVDLLDYRHLVGVTLSIIRNKDLHPTTIGIYGDWGSGKSSLLKLTQKEIGDGEDGVLCVNFNGWLFEGYDDAKSALIDTLLDEIEKKTKPSAEAKDTLVRLSKRVNWMRVAWTGSKLASGMLLGGMGLGVSSGIEMLAQSLASHFGNIDYEAAKDFLVQQSDEEDVLGIRDFHRDFSDLLEKSDISTLVVFIDDLDRCNPETIIETLEAIKLFLFAPQTVFVIGADERLVEYAVAKRFPELPEKDFNVGRDYLEKLIQFPVRIPPVGQAELETYIHLLFVSLADLNEEAFERIRLQAVEERAPGDVVNPLTLGMIRGEVDTINPDIEDVMTLSQFIAPVLAPGMSGNPRQTKRFLNLLMMRLEMAKARRIPIERRVLAKLMLLEHFRPKLFHALAKVQIQEEGKPKLLQLVETRLLKDGQCADDVADAQAEVAVDLEDARDLEAWVDNDWIANKWVRFGPKLGDVDLRPYFFFAREQIGFATAQVRSLSPMAQQVVRDLSSNSEAVQNRALEQAKSLDQVEATVVFSEFVQQAGNEEDPRAHTLLLIILIRLVEQRTELQSDLVMLLRDEPVILLKPNILPALEMMSKKHGDTSSEKTVLMAWVESGHADIVTDLARARLGNIQLKSKVLKIQEER